MEKILKFEFASQMVSYPLYSDYLGVLVANNYDINNILFNNFLTLYYTPDNRFSHNPNQIGFRRFTYIKNLFNCEKLKIDYSNPIKSVCENIDNSKYVEIILKINFLYNIPDYPKTLYHNMLIYGYNSDDKYFYAVGFLLNKQNNYTYKKVKISFDEFLEVLPDAQTKTGYENNVMYNHTFCLPENFSTEKINHRKIIFDLIRYIIPIPPRYFNRCVCKRYAEYLSRHIGQLDFLDLRNLVVLNDHKKNLYSLTVTLSKDDKLIKEIKTKISDKISMLLIWAAKYNVTHDEALFRYIIRVLKEISADEKTLLFRLLKELTKGFLHRNEKDTSNS